MVSCMLENAASKTRQMKPWQCMLQDWHSIHSIWEVRGDAEWVAINACSHLGLFLCVQWFFLTTWSTHFADSSASLQSILWLERTIMLLTRLQPLHWLPLTTQHQTQYRGTMQIYSDAKNNHGHYNAGVANGKGKSCRQWLNVTDDGYSVFLLEEASVEQLSVTW